MAEKIMQGIKQISELIGQAVKKRVVCLYRVSTVGQVEKDDIPMQKQYCREFCRGQSGWEIASKSPPRTETQYRKFKKWP